MWSSLTRAAPWYRGPWPAGADDNYVRGPGFRPASPLPSVDRHIVAARGVGLSTLTGVIAAVPVGAVWVISLPAPVASVIPAGRRRRRGVARRARLAAVVGRGRVPGIGLVRVGAGRRLRCGRRRGRVHVAAVRVAQAGLGRRRLGCGAAVAAPPWGCG